MNTKKDARRRKVEGNKMNVDSSEENEEEHEEEGESKKQTKSKPKPEDKDGTKEVEGLEEAMSFLMMTKMDDEILLPNFS